jgi:hypothetical protein
MQLQVSVSDMALALPFRKTIMYDAFLEGVLFGKQWIADSIYRHARPAVFVI